ncbi:MAG TPA: Do family serine endopeptidase [Thermoanaerobaculia bacterium]|nr:Do family serine endopeptidase [Thermoanaerobaculia bacterium]
MDGMRTKTKVLSLAALLTGSVVFGMILAGSLDFTKFASAQKTAAAPPAAAAAAPAPVRGTQIAGLPSFADIAEQVMPAIVSVTATDIIKADKRRRSYHNFGNGDGQDPFDFFFGPDGPKRRGAEDDEDQKQLSGGTGFLIESDGYILTNNHVIEGAEKIEIKVGDKDDYTAKVVGRDPASDLALLKIEGPRPFPVVKLGDSDHIRVGEWVMAIGDPLNFDKSVTVGVISGKGRYAGLSRATANFESLLQTDAAINFGNSGGPLVNVAGEVVGINTAMARAQNIGFAVPVNMAKRLMPQLRKGKVVRGFLGVDIESINRKWQEAFELKAPEGALVRSVVAGKPADKAGLRHDDIITKVDDVAVKNNHDLVEYVSGRAPGARVTIAYLRDGKEKTTVATLEERLESGEKPAMEEEDSKAGKQKMLGLDLDDLTPQARRAYGLDREIQKGVLVTHVKPVSPAGDANLQEGDVILEVNGVAVGSVDELQAQIRKAPKGKYVRFYVQRGGAHGAAQRFLAAVKPE